MQHLFIQSEHILLPASAVSTLLESLKSFDDAVIIARAADFPDYSEEVFPSVRPNNLPHKAELFSDVFSPLSNLKFLTYLKDFS